MAKKSILTIFLSTILFLVFLGVLYSLIQAQIPNEVKMQKMIKTSLANLFPGSEVKMNSQLKKKSSFKTVYELDEMTLVFLEKDEIKLRQLKMEIPLLALVGGKKIEISAESLEIAPWQSLPKLQTEERIPIPGLLANNKINFSFKNIQLVSQDNALDVGGVHLYDFSFHDYTVLEWLIPLNHHKFKILGEVNIASLFQGPSLVWSGHGKLLDQKGIGQKSFDVQFNKSHEIFDLSFDGEDDSFSLKGNLIQSQAQLEYQFSDKLSRELSQDYLEIDQDFNLAGAILLDEQLNLKTESKISCLDHSCQGSIQMTKDSSHLVVNIEYPKGDLAHTTLVMPLDLSQSQSRKKVIKEYRALELESCHYLSMLKQFEEGMESITNEAKIFGKYKCPGQQGSFSLVLQREMDQLQTLECMILKEKKQIAQCYFSTQKDEVQLKIALIQTPTDLVIPFLGLPAIATSGSLSGQVIVDINNENGQKMTARVNSDAQIQSHLLPTLLSEIKSENGVQLSLYDQFQFDELIYSSNSVEEMASFKLSYEGGEITAQLNFDQQQMTGELRLKDQSAYSFDLLTKKWWKDE